MISAEPFQRAEKRKYVWENSETEVLKVPGKRTLIPSSRLKDFIVAEASDATISDSVLHKPEVNGADQGMQWYDSF